jgi:hypothetical protein
LRDEFLEAVLTVRRELIERVTAGRAVFHDKKSGASVFGCELMDRFLRGFGGDVEFGDVHGVSFRLI